MDWPSSHGVRSPMRWMGILTNSSSNIALWTSWSICLSKWVIKSKHLLGEKADVCCNATCVVEKRLMTHLFHHLCTLALRSLEKVVITSDELVDSRAPVFKGLLAPNERWPLLHILSGGHSWAVNMRPFHSLVSFGENSKMWFQMIHQKWMSGESYVWRMRQCRLPLCACSKTTRSCVSHANTCCDP